MRRVSFKVLQELLERAADPERAERIIAEGLVECRMPAVTEVRRCFVERRSPNGAPWAELKHPRPGEQSRGDPLVDSGRLMNGIEATSDGSTLKIYVRRMGCRLMHFGGEVLPKKGKYLAIPETAEAKAAGSPRNMPFEMRPIIGKIGGVLLGPYVPGAKLKDLEVQFYLSKGVTIPPRPFMEFSSRSVENILSIVGRRWWRSFWEQGGD